MARLGQIKVGETRVHVVGYGDGTVVGIRPTGARGGGRRHQLDVATQAGIIVELDAGGRIVRSHPQLEPPLKRMETP